MNTKGLLIVFTLFSTLTLSSCDDPTRIIGAFLNPMTATNNTTAITLGDVNGDGHIDMVAGNNRSQANRVYMNNGAANFTDSGQTLGANHTYAITLGDVDGDGDLDLVDGIFNMPNRIYFNKGDGNFNDSGQELGRHRTSSITLGDVDGDGDLDLVEGNLDLYESSDPVPVGYVRQTNRVYINLTN